MLILTSQGVTKQFGGLVAVNKFDFDIPEGKIVSIIGPNGAGKTTSSTASPASMDSTRAQSNSTANN